MNVQSIEPGRDTGALLAGAQFADAFRITVDDARSARALRPRRC
jgi:hypothetical protein